MTKRFGSSRKRTVALMVLLTGYGPAFANDYPTLERVDAVLTCMALKGGQTIDNLYACACEIDAISGRMTFDEYSEARTYEQYARMPADKGALFRDSDEGRALKDKLTQVRTEAEKQCFMSGQVRAAKVTDKTKIIEGDASQTAKPAVPESGN